MEDFDMSKVNALPKFKVAEHLDSLEVLQEYVKAVFEDYGEDISLIKQALETAVEAKVLNPE